MLRTLLHNGDLLASIGWKVLDRFRFGTAFALSPHGVGIAVGYLAGAYVLMHEGPKRGVPQEKISSLVFWGLIGSIIGARVGYVLSHLSEFHSVGDVLAVYRGGISLIGGIIGWVVVSIPLIRRYKISMLNTFDAATMPLALGIVIGRVGDLIIGDHLGQPTSWLLAWKYYGGNLSGYDCTTLPGACTTALANGHSQTITERGATLFGSAHQVVAHGVGVHQTALYDFVSSMVLVVLLLWLAPRVRRVGVLLVVFAMWYAGVRIVTDFLRVENRFLGLTGSQWTSIVVILVCLGLLAWIRRSGREIGSPEPAPGDQATV